jgi:HTH-type transcriptional regulator/antitoxin HigA
VRVISRPVIIKFSRRHPDALVSLMNWYRITRRANWNSLPEVRSDFGHAENKRPSVEIDDTAYAELLAKSRPRPIRNDEEHERLTNLLLELDEREDLSPEEEALAEVLTLLIEDYEEKRYPLPCVSPHESLNALMEERGFKHKDIWPILGNKGAATEVLAGHRSISKAQAKRLAEFFRVPVELFI